MRLFRWWGWRRAQRELFVPFCLWHTCSSALGLWNCLLIWKSAAIQWHAFFAYVHFLEIVSAAHLKPGEVTGTCWSGIWDCTEWKTKRLQGEHCGGKGRLKMPLRGGGETSGCRRAGHFHWTGESWALLSRQGGRQQPWGLFTSKSINIKYGAKFNFSATLAPIQWPRVTSGCHVGQHRWENRIITASSVRQCWTRGKSNPGVVCIHQDMLNAERVTAILEDRAWCRDAALSCGVHCWPGQQRCSPLLAWTAGEGPRRDLLCSHHAPLTRTGPNIPAFLQVVCNWVFCMPTARYLTIIMYCYYP